MYCAYDENKKIIAIHDKKRVIKTYIDRIYENHQISLYLGKLKDSSEYKVKNHEDLYLVKYGDTYIQSGYLIYNQINLEPIIEDDEYALDVLYRILETERLNNKDSKSIINAIKVLEKIVKEDRRYTPTMEELVNFKTNYESYLFSVKSSK